MYKALLETFETKVSFGQTVLDYQDKNFYIVIHYRKYHLLFGILSKKIDVA